MTGEPVCPLRRSEGLLHNHLFVCVKIADPETVWGWHNCSKVVPHGLEDLVEPNQIINLVEALRPKVTSESISTLEALLTELQTFVAESCTLLKIMQTIAKAFQGIRFERDGGRDCEGDMLAYTLRVDSVSTVASRKSRFDLLGLNLK